MDLGSDLGNYLVLAGVLLVVFLALDLLVAGGSATCGVAGGVGGMMGGIGSMMGAVGSMMATPWGWGLLLLVAATAGVVLGGQRLLGGGG